MKVECQKQFTVSASRTATTPKIYFVAPNDYGVTSYCLWNANIDGSSPAKVSAYSSYADMTCLAISQDNGFVYFAIDGTAPSIGAAVWARQCNAFVSYGYVVYHYLGPYSLAIDDYGLMFYCITYNGYIYRKSLLGNGDYPGIGGPAQLCWNLGPYGASSIALDNTNSMMYWACLDGIRRAPINGPFPLDLIHTAKIITPTTSYVIDKYFCLDVENDFIFWFELNPGAIFSNLWRSKLDGTNRQLLYGFVGVGSPFNPAGMAQTYQAPIKQYNHKLYFGCTLPYWPPGDSDWLGTIEEDGSGLVGIRKSPTGFNTQFFPVTSLDIL